MQTIRFMLPASLALASCKGKSKEELAAEKRCTVSMLQEGFSQQEQQRLQKPAADFCSCYFGSFEDIQEIKRKSQRREREEVLKRYEGVFKKVEKKQRACSEQLFKSVSAALETKDSNQVRTAIHTMFRGLTHPYAEPPPPTEEERNAAEQARIADSLDLIRRFGPRPPDSE